jgi:hypothetical protein
MHLTRRLASLRLIFTLRQPVITAGVGTARVRFPAGEINLSVVHRVQTGPGAHSAPYSMGTRGSFPSDKAEGV